MQISEALRRFGINETSNYILVGRFDATAEEVNIKFQSRLSSNIVQITSLLAAYILVACVDFAWSSILYAHELFY